MAEAYHGVYLIFELVLPSRNLMQLYIWWQYLRMRYMVDQSGGCILYVLPAVYCTVFGITRHIISGV